MGSDWVYYTNIRPRRKRLYGDEGDSEYKNELNNAFSMFLEECKIPLGDLEEFIYNKDCYKFNILTDKKNNVINQANNYHIKFLKSRFLQNGRFKKELINYYNPVGYFVKGPQQENDSNWFLEISRMKTMC